MIHAVIRGKTGRDEVYEDLLTSTVFGMLKHLPVQEVWLPLLERARTEDHGVVSNVRQVLEEQALTCGASLNEYTKVTVSFWPEHATQGEPDLLVLFQGGPQPLACLIEVKLWSPKGVGEDDTKDQLCRYFRALMDMAFPAEAITRRTMPCAFIYLTALVSSREVADSRAKWRDSQTAFRCFELSWQDVVESVRTSSAGLAKEPEVSIASDLCEFLTAMTLAPFRGFACGPVPEFADVPGWRYASSSPSNEFDGFSLQDVDLTAQRLYSAFRRGHEFWGFSTHSLLLEASQTVYSPHFGGNEFWGFDRSWQGLGRDPGSFYVSRRTTNGARAR